MIAIKTPSEIEAMRRSARVASAVLRQVMAAVAPGVTTVELERIALDRMAAAGARSAFKGYRGYPGAICVSVNEEVVHGIPGVRKIRMGDLVSIDVGVVFNGFYGDNAGTVLVGGGDRRRRLLVDTTRDALQAGIEACVDGVRMGAVSHAIETTARTAGCSVVRDYVGHGIGRALHEEPQIPNYGPVHSGPRLKSGMVLCIEPMINLGTAGVRVLEDGWTAVTQDGNPSAHFEHMVLVCDHGAEVMTGADRDAGDAFVF